VSVWLPGLALAALAAVGALAWRERRRADRLGAEVAAMRAGLVASTRLASLGNLVAGLVHEINTPMGALSSNHDVIKRALQRLQVILADQQVDETELNEVRRIVRALDEVDGANALAVERVNGLVKSLRDFGRPDRSEIAWADLHEGIDSTLAILRHELGGIEVIKDYGDVPAVLCRPQQLNQVFMNLLVNACQAMGGAGRLTLRTRRQGEQVRISITDTGCGIPPANQARIFEPGFTTKGARVGMGMGLLITRQIVEQHEGTITLTSNVNAGTCFTVTLPIAPISLERQVNHSTPEVLT
jgi:two-component system NtrC family sensor kinase